MDEQDEKEQPQAAASGEDPTDPGSPEMELMGETASPEDPGPPQMESSKFSERERGIALSEVEIEDS